MNGRRTFMSASRIAAFSLIELLVVMGIISIMVSLFVSSGRSLLESNNLSRGGRMVVDQIQVARQIASARNLPIEVRFIKTDSGSDGYDSVQLWTKKLASNGEPTYVAAGRMVHLPQSIAIAENSSVSGFFGVASKKTMTVNGTSADYYAMEIAPSGFVTPKAAMANMFLTVLPTRSASTGSLSPSQVKNYVAIQVNPTTGTPTVFQP